MYYLMNHLVTTGIFKGAIGGGVVVVFILLRAGRRIRADKLNKFKEASLVTLDGSKKDLTKIQEREQLVNEKGQTMKFSEEKQVELVITLGRLIESTLATIEYMNGLKRASKTEFNRQITMAQESLFSIGLNELAILKQNTTYPTPNRLADVLGNYHGNVKKWSSRL